MRNLTIIFLLLSQSVLLSAQQNKKDFVVVYTNDTISIKDNLFAHRYFRIITSPDTFYIGENGHIFELSKVDKRVDYPGGNAGLKNWLKDNIQYPPSARQSNLSGTVVIKFVVDEFGHSIRPEVLKSIHPTLDQEALRVVSSITNWIPAVVSNKNVKSYFMLPISFNLE